MPRQQTVLQILVASPSDVRAEREALEHVIDELNLAWSQSPVRLELIRWETHANPGIGEDVQAVINRQMPADYDIFVGIMWGRFGSPTGRAGSGTEEEFDRALQRRQSEGEAVELMLYFKDAPIPPSQIDTDQLSKVHAFKTRANGEGVLYQAFIETAEFEYFTRIHLSRIALGWLQRTGARSTATDVTLTTEAFVSPLSNLETDEPGFIDLIEASLDHMNEATTVTERMGEATEALGQQITLRTRSMEELSKSGRGGDFKAIKRVTNMAAEDMEQFVARMRLETPIFAEHYERAITSFSQAVSLSPELRSNSADTESLRTLESVAESMSSLGKSMTVGRASMEGLRNIIATLPRMTTVFNRAKRSTVTVLDAFLRELDSAIALTSDAENGVRSLIKNQRIEPTENSR